MSHLDHIVRLKQELIREGINEPEVQIEIARGAYVKALITHACKHDMCEDERIAFHKYILSYWNETTPVQGHVVLSQVGNFFRALKKCVDGVLISNDIKLEVIPAVKGAGEKKYTELATYSLLIETLLAEADHKLPQFNASRVEVE
uniref:Uncharacterized protein n=1 Tax=Pantoea phage Survivor TaxID=3232176 RepID=A0AAU8KX74_9CAUD